MGTHSHTHPLTTSHTSATPLWLNLNPCILTITSWVNQSLRKGLFFYLSHYTHLFSLDLATCFNYGTRCLPSLTFLVSCLTFSHQAIVFSLNSSNLLSSARSSGSCAAWKKKSLLKVYRRRMVERPNSVTMQHGRFYLDGRFFQPLQLHCPCPIQLDHPV